MNFEDNYLMNFIIDYLIINYLIITHFLSLINWDLVSNEIEGQKQTSLGAHC